MNFFEHQEAARRSSTRLVLLFTLAVAAIVGAVDVVVWLASGSVEAVVAASLLTGVVIGLGSLYRIASLRGGGAAVAAQLGGTWVPEDTRDPALRRLRNVVEEVAIASGVPVPRLFVLEQEAGINAFAAGYGTADAAIAVTRGALDRLNRDELQAVIAHEFSHILNGDMRLNIRLMGVLFGIMMLSLIGQRILLHAPSVRGRNSNASAVLAVMLAALVAIVIGSLGVFFGRLIQAAVSRQREYLADASAVQFTRQPAALAGALKKIAGLHAGARLEDRAGAGEVAHMLFAQGFHLAGWMATHPPLLERIAFAPGVTLKQEVDGRVVISGRRLDMDASTPLSERSRQILQHAAQFFPQLRDAKILRVIEGLRVYPGSPGDGFPIIGYAGNYKNVYLTFSHSGVTLAPVIAQLATQELLEGVEIDVLSPYRLSRYT